MDLSYHLLLSYYQTIYKYLDSSTKCTFV